MTDFRIGLFYPTSTAVHTYSRAMKELNPQIRDGKNHLAVIRAAEAAGLDYAFLADGWGSHENPHMHKYEFNDPMLMGPILASMLLAATDNIRIINTVHHAWLHPLTIARMGANMSVLSGERWGMNAVSGVGFNPQLVKSVTKIDKHDDFYKSATESMEIIQQIWANEGEVDFDGEFFQAKGKLVGPIPKTMPPVVSAGSSPAGCAFAGRFADIVFIPGESSANLIEDRRKMIIDTAEKAGRDSGKIKFLLNMTVVLGHTEAEAEELSKQLFDNLDPEAMAAILGSVSATSDTYRGILEKTEEMKNLPEDERPVTNGPMTDWRSGDATKIADAIQEVYERKICDGLSVSFSVWQPERIELFGKQVVPQLEERGIWTSAAKRGWSW